MATQPNNTKQDNDTDHRDVRERVRFNVELEFVQALANPDYILHLAQLGYFEDERFLTYLKYLRDYWSTAQYARYLLSPSCLDVLHMILNVPASALVKLKDPAFKTLMFDQQFYWWQYQKE